MKADVYERITAQIVSDLEKGVRPWFKPWNAEHAAGRITRPLRGNGIPYRGINVVMLWSEAMSKGYSAPIWMTFRQAMELNAHVKKGEKGSPVVYASKITRTETEEDTGNEVERDIPFLRAYYVFNVEQIEGLPGQYYAKAEPRLNTAQRIERAEAFFAATGVNIQHGGDRAFYSPLHDRVQMPHFETFKDAEAYYAVLAHEITHSSGAKHRLNRDLSGRFGSESYAAEELIAELGSAFLSADLDLTPEPREDHASYVASWLKVLRDDRRAIFTAAAHAQRAADYLNGLQPGAQQEAAE